MVVCLLPEKQEQRCEVVKLEGPEKTDQAEAGDHRERAKVRGRLHALPRTRFAHDVY